MKLKALTPAKKAHPPGAYVVLSSSTAAEFLGEKGRRSFTPALRHCNLPPCLERLLVLYVVSPRRSDVFELAAQSECTTICAALLTHERTRMTTGVRRMGQMELR